MPLVPTLPPTADWHLHTVLSDGFAGADALLERAAALGLRSIAITDHDCLDAHASGALAARGAALGIEVVTGAEIDCSLHGAETEVLAFRFDPAHPGLAGLLRRVQAQRWARFRFYCEGLAAAGAPIDPGALPGTGTRVPIKVHLFRALVAAGVFREGQYKEFKQRLAALGAAPPVDKPTLAEAVAVARAAGGVTVLAHPLYYRGPIGLERLLSAGAEAGCAGVELSYPYRFGAKGLCEGEVREGLADLVRLADRCFPGGALLTRGTDMHEPAEWAGRLAELAAQESVRGPDPAR